MAIDVYLQFESYTAGTFGNPIPASGLAEDGGTFFEIDDYTVEFEQTLNIGSQAAGAGAGKVSFQPFTVTRRSDTMTPKLFQLMCSGTPFKTVKLFMYKAGGSGHTLVTTITFKLAAIKSLVLAPDDSDTPSETISFEYGGVLISTPQLNTKGAPTGNQVTLGWNRVRNVSDNTLTPIK